MLLNPWIACGHPIERRRRWGCPLGWSARDGSDSELSGRGGEDFVRRMGGTRECEWRRFGRRRRGKVFELEIINVTVKRYFRIIRVGGEVRRGGGEWRSGGTFVIVLIIERLYGLDGFPVTTDTERGGVRRVAIQTDRRLERRGRGAYALQTRPVRLGAVSPHRTEPVISLLAH